MSDHVQALITGGAGYIGSQLAHDLVATGASVVVLDNLVAGSRAAVPHDATFIEGDCGDPDVLAAVFRDHPIDVVFHLAALIDNAESVARPNIYRRVNFDATRVLADACIDFGITRFIFASSAAVYGVPSSIPVTEDAPTDPQTPYGQSKRDSERYLKNLRDSGLNSVAIRFFNAGGADPQGRTGPRNLSGHGLLTAACETVLGHRQEFLLFGDNYDTADGTCIRDFIHVADIAQAYTKAAAYLAETTMPTALVVNCGYGHGYSVRQIIDTVETLADRKMNVTIAARRPGDVAEVVAEASAIKTLFDWQPAFDSLDVIVGTTLRWHSLMHDSASSSPNNADDSHD